MTDGELDINAIQKEAYEQGLKDGLKEPRPPCACEGKVLATVKGWINKDDPFYLQEDLKLIPHVPHQLHISGLSGKRSVAFATRVQMDAYVRVIILEEKP